MVPASNRRSATDHTWPPLKTAAAALDDGDEPSWGGRADRRGTWGARAAAMGDSWSVHGRDERASAHWTESTRPRRGRHVPRPPPARPECSASWVIQVPRKLSGIGTSYGGLVESKWVLFNLFWPFLVLVLSEHLSNVVRGAQARGRPGAYASPHPPMRAGWRVDELWRSAVDRRVRTSWQRHDGRVLQPGATSPIALHGP